MNERAPGSSSLGRQARRTRSAVSQAMPAAPPAASQASIRASVSTNGAASVMPTRSKPSARASAFTAAARAASSAEEGSSFAGKGLSAVRSSVIGIRPLLGAEQPCETAQDHPAGQRAGQDERNERRRIAERAELSASIAQLDEPDWRDQHPAPTSAPLLAPCASPASPEPVAHLGHRDDRDAAALHRRAEHGLGAGAEREPLGQALDEWLAALRLRSVPRLCSHVPSSSRGLPSAPRADGASSPHGSVGRA